MVFFLAAVSDFLNTWLIAASFFLFIFLAFLSGTIRAVQSRSWPHVRGKILECEVRSNLQHTSQVQHRKASVRYEPTVRYSYEVDGKPLESTQIAIGVVSGSEAAAKAVCARYPKNSEVVVFHHPKSHFLAVLEPGRFMLPLLSALLTGAVAAFMTTVWIHKSLHLKEPPIQPVHSEKILPLRQPLHE